MSNFNRLIKQAQHMRAKLTEAQNKLRELEITKNPSVRRTRMKDFLIPLFFLCACSQLEENTKGEHDVLVNEYTTPLHKACFEGKIDVVKSLIANKADVNAKNSYDSTPLGYAVWKNHYEVVEFLLKNGASPHGLVTSDTVYTRSALAEAIFQNNHRMIALLKKYGADINEYEEITKDTGEYEDFINPLIQAVIDGDYIRTEILLRNGAEIECGAWQMRSVTPLHIAAMAGDYKMVKLLAERGASIEGTHYWGITPLSSAADLGKNYPENVKRAIRSAEEYAKIVEFLIEKGANVNNIEKYGIAL